MSYAIERQENNLTVKYRHLKQGNFEFVLPKVETISTTEKETGKEENTETTHQVKLLEANQHLVSFELDGVRYLFQLAKNQSEYYLRNERLGGVTLTLQDRLPEKEAEKIKGGYEAPMPSQIIKVLVETGQEVKSGDGLVILSSMKMENTIVAEENGTVEDVFIQEGQSIEAGVLLIKIKEEVEA